MKNIKIYIALILVSVLGNASVYAASDKEDAKGYLTGSFESTSNYYLSDSPLHPPYLMPHTLMRYPEPTQE